METITKRINDNYFEFDMSGVNFSKFTLVSEVGQEQFERNEIIECIIGTIEYEILDMLDMVSGDLTGEYSTYTHRVVEMSGGNKADRVDIDFSLKLDHGVHYVTIK